MRTERQPHGAEGPNRDRRLLSLSRYDVVLALLPLAILLPAVASGLLGVTLHTALGVGSLLGVAVLADALFLNPPRTGGPTG